jgi:hypothetical protein
MPLNLADVISLTTQGFLTCHKTLPNRVDCFTSPEKKVVLRIFIALKIHHPRPYLNPRTLGSKGNHANHYTNEDDVKTRRNTGILWKR